MSKLITDKELWEYESIPRSVHAIESRIISRLRSAEEALRIYEVAPDLKFRISCPGCEPDCDLKHYGRHNPARAHFAKVTP